MPGGAPKGEDPLVFTASGAEDSGIPAFRAAVRTAGLDLITVSEAVGKARGRVLNTLLRESVVKRVVLPLTRYTQLEEELKLRLEQLELSSRARGTPKITAAQAASRHHARCRLPGLFLCESTSRKV